MKWGYSKLSVHAVTLLSWLSSLTFAAWQRHHFSFFRSDTSKCDFIFICVPEDTVGIEVPGLEALAELEALLWRLLGDNQDIDLFQKVAVVICCAGAGKWLLSGREAW